jgi:hypothetical protein
MEHITKPPLGLMPKKYYYEQVKNERFKQVCEAITKYYNAGLHINIEWVDEYNELIKNKKDMKQTAVEWLEKELKKIPFANPKEAFDQAKEMEMEQRGYSEEEVKEILNEFMYNFYENSIRQDVVVKWFEQFKKK